MRGRSKEKKKVFAREDSLSFGNAEMVKKDRNEGGWTRPRGRGGAGKRQERQTENVK